MVKSYEHEIVWRGEYSLYFRPKGQCFTAEFDKETQYEVTSEVFAKFEKFYTLLYGENDK